jgi:adenosylcobinamide-GDP ribazoletransferase
VTVLVSLLAAALLITHCVRRFGGITGDVMGAAIEATTTLTLMGLVIRS